MEGSTTRNHASLRRSWSGTPSGGCEGWSYVCRGSQGWTPVHANIEVILEICAGASNIRIPTQEIIQGNFAVIGDRLTAFIFDDLVESVTPIGHAGLCWLRGGDSSAGGCLRGRGRFSNTDVVVIFEIRAVIVDVIPGQKVCLRNTSVICDGLTAFIFHYLVEFAASLSHATKSWSRSCDSSACWRRQC